MTMDTRNSTELCLYALNEFVFLERVGYVPSREVSSCWFNIVYASASESVSFSIGALLSRHEYGVTIVCDEQKLGLDEVTSVLDAPSGDTPDWTWAHSETKVFREHISYSAALLRRHLPRLMTGFDEVLHLIVNTRRAAAKAQEILKRSAAAEAAFQHGEWRMALQMYRSLTTLTKLQQKRMEIAAQRDASSGTKVSG